MSRLFHRLFTTIIPGIVLAHTVFFLMYWLTNNLFYTETNDYLAKMLGAPLDYLRLCFLVSALIGLWSAARLLSFKIRLKPRLATLAAWLYGVIALIYLAFFYGSYALLLSESPVQLNRFGQLVSYYRLLLDPLLMLGAALLAGLWVRGIFRQRKAAGRRVIFGPVLVAVLALALLWALPLVYPPDSVYRGALPPKPLLIAHRGASMLAPENTLASAKLAAGLGVYGLETDIHISRDGIPFLLHDDTFLRTTDIKAVYPDRAKERAEYFTLAEITRLNAGKWFVERDPYQTIAGGQVSKSQMVEDSLQTIPTLAEELAIVRQNNLTFSFFDISQPPDDHPYASSFFDICLNEIQKAGIDEQVWIQVNKEQLKVLNSIAPAMKPVYRAEFQTPPLVDELKASGYQAVNAEYGLSKGWIRKYQQANIWVNLFTIDEPWQFSRLWLLGADSTTTSNAHTMAALSRPVLSLPFDRYLVLWSVVGILGLVLVTGLAIPAYRLRGLPVRQS